MLFAEIEPSNPATVWAVLMTFVTSVSGIVMYVLRQRDKAEIRRQERQKELREELAKQKAQEAANRSDELAAIKKDMNSLYTKWKDIAELFRTEKEAAQKAYEEKYAEVVHLTVQVEELKKRLGEQ